MPAVVTARECRTGTSTPQADATSARAAASARGDVHRAGGSAGHRPRAHRAHRRGGAARAAGRRWPTARRPRRCSAPGDHREALTDEDDGVSRAGPGRARRRRRCRSPCARAPQHLGLGARVPSEMSVPPTLARPPVATGGHGVHGGAVLAERLAQAQEDDRALVLGLQADEQHGAGRLEVGVGDRAALGAGRDDGRSRPAPCCSSASSRWTRARSSSCACARRSAGTAPAVYAVAPVATRGLAKVGTLIRPRHRARGAARPRRGVGHRRRRRRRPAPTTRVLVGERLATVPGALSAAVALAEATGARLAWVPRRAGERGALEAGALPTLLPGGRPLADAAARAEVASAWGVESLADTAGRDTAGIVAARHPAARRARRRRGRPARRVPRHPHGVRRDGGPRPVPGARASRRPWPRRGR